MVEATVSLELKFVLPLPYVVGRGINKTRDQFFPSWTFLQHFQLCGDTTIPYNIEVVDGQILYFFIVFLKIVNTGQRQATGDDGTLALPSLQFHDNTPSISYVS
ncbi:uncharacterized protein LOC130704053 [Daphnia carinata]|uniref:uncharacterized protein LOC130704053 n=1 Tax=Daphnia carinata TaxID=120202 RepID=UPI00257EB410|nr:uncharacterized protein LOC130704053 [Daphnia carinata]